MAKKVAVDRHLGAVDGQWRDTEPFRVNVMGRLTGRALAQEPARRASLKDIKHVVMLMQENRSFDHYFGTLAGVRGFDDPNALKMPDHQQ